jgi:hypothetical protein
MADPKEIRKKLADDFAYYASHCVLIRPKNGDNLVPLTFNAPQKRLHDAIEGQIKSTGKVRIIILKARQQGFSTYVHGRIYWKLSHRYSRKGLVVAHIADSTRTLFDMYKRTHTNTPKAVQMQTKYSSRKELVFSELDTGLMVATAGGDAIARGETINDAHLSEVAFWPSSTASDNFNALMACVPNSRDTDVYIESTANGMSGIFYELWRGAVEGKNDFLPFFSPWFDTPEYRMDVPSYFERTLEEEDIAKEFSLDNGQLMFRRVNIATHGLEKFRQEYPSTPEEAFIASGRPVFNPDQIHEMLKASEPPLYHMTHEEPTFVKNPHGALKVWREIQNNETYYIGADGAMGIRNGDYSVAQVLDSQKRLAASFRDHVHPDYFARILFDLGMYYNEAKVIVENNSHGLLTAIRLGRDLAYPNVYTEIAEGALNDRDSISIGFRTTEKSKPLIIDRLRAALRENELDIRDATTLREMLSFIVTETGKMEAETGNHDDTVMALALANHIHDGKFTPIPCTDEYYVPAI